MRAEHSIVVNLLVFVLAEGFALISTESEPPLRSYSSFYSGVHQRRYLTHSLKENEKPKRQRKILPSLKTNLDLVKRLTNRWIATDDKAKKHSEVAFGSGMTEGYGMSQQHDDNNIPKNSQIPRLLADYGILGISDDEDSAKWASDEMKTVVAATGNKETTSGEIQSGKMIQNVTNMANLSKQFSIKNIETSEKIAPGNTMGLNGTKSKYIQVFKESISDEANRPDTVSESKNVTESRKSPESANLAKSLEQTTTTSKETSAGSISHNTTMNKNSENVPLIAKSDNTFNHTSTEQPKEAQGYGMNTHNGSVHQMASQTTQSNANKGELKIEASKGAKAESVGLLPQSNQTTTNEQFFSQALSPSLVFNVTSLRKGQSFDLQLPTAIPSKGSYHDNHFHLGPKETFKSSEYSPKDLGSNSSNSYFLNVTLDKVIPEEKEKATKPNKLLQNLNSDILASRAEPLTNNVNRVENVNDETFREESPAGRTVAENVLEPNVNEALFNQRPGSLQQREGQTEVQQDESLARALNSSSVSAVILSANRAIFDTDKQEFSKKSAQGRLHSKDKEHKHKHKRSNILSQLTKYHHKKFTSSSDSPRKNLQKHGKQVSARQVINLGSHFLWFGGQSAADANGFPRHNTAAENNPYNVDRYISNFINTDNDKEAASATKGYRALQNALSSMESNHDRQGVPSISDSMYAVPSNKEWQDSDHGQSPANVVIQDETGKPVYQGVVDIIKYNKSSSNDSVHSESSSQSNDVSISQHVEASDKENRTDNAQAEHDSLRNTHSSNQNATPGMDNSSNPITSHQDGSGYESQTVIQSSKVSIGHDDDTNSTVASGSKQILKAQESNQTEAQQNTTQQIKPGQQDLPKYSNETLPTTSVVPNKQQPSAIIKKINSNSQEPETYHVIVNDAGKKITDASGHVTVIISGPTATQASMPDDNTMLIPQTTPSSDWSPEKDYASSNKNTLSALSENADYSTQPRPLLQNESNDNVNIQTQTVDSTTENVNKIDVINANKQISPLSLLQEDIVPAPKISEGIEGQLKKSQSDGIKATIDSHEKKQNQSKQALSLHTTAKENSNSSSESTEAFTQRGHSFVNIGQDLTGDVDGLQMEEVSRPNIQPEQQKEQEKLLEEPLGGFLEGGDLSAAAMQSRDVPTLNIVLNPMQRVGGSLSVGGKVIPISSTKEEDSRLVSFANDQSQQQLDCHAETKNEKTSTTVLTCQKRHGLAIFPQRFGRKQGLPTQGGVYYGDQRMKGGPALQLEQVMNVLNDQVKATINKEMKTESKDIENVLTGMTVPTSTLMDTDEADSQSEPPPHSSLMDADETFTSQPDFVRHSNWKHRRPYHRKFQQFGFPNNFGFRHNFGFSHHPGVPRHLGLPHRRHFWGYNHKSNPFVIMAHKDSDEGFWDYQHNIFIPREFSHEDDNDGEEQEQEDNREKHWFPWSQHGHRRGNWVMARPPLKPRHSNFAPFIGHDLFHLRLPTMYGLPGPWTPPHHTTTATQVHKQVQGDKRTAVMHKTMRGDRDMCSPVIEGPSPPLKGEWEYLGKVLSSCPCRLTEW